MSRYVMILLGLLLLFSLNCGPKVMVPPKIDLVTYEVLGLVEFSSNTEGNLSSYATHNFLEAITEDQTGIRVVELGKEADILAELNQSRMGPEAIKAIGEKYALKTIITGNLEVGEPSPDIDFWGSFKNMNISTDVEATLTAKMVETASGATVWTGSATDTREITGVGLYGNTFHFDSEDPDKAYGKLVNSLVEQATEDFRVTWTRK
ncbi:hypothetical protein JXI42_07940 [bacterium]|nr:hypothetical protein [bacterium]